MKPFKDKLLIYKDAYYHNSIVGKFDRCRYDTVVHRVWAHAVRNMNLTGFTSALQFGKDSIQPECMYRVARMGVSFRLYNINGGVARNIYWKLHKNLYRLYLPRRRFR